MTAEEIVKEFFCSPLKANMEEAGLWMIKKIKAAEEEANESAAQVADQHRYGYACCAHTAKSIAIAIRALQPGEKPKP